MHISMYIRWMKRGLLGLLGCIVFTMSPHSFAQPVIAAVEGGLVHGEEVTIRGSGFGARANYNNINESWHSGQFLNFRFKDFEDGALSSFGMHPERSGASWVPKNDELGLRSGGPGRSAYYMRRAYSGNELGGLSADVRGAGDVLYTTFKFMLEPNTQSGKFWRFYADSPQNNVYLSTGCTSASIRGYSECTDGSCDPKTEWGSGPALQPGQWHRIEILADATANQFTVSVDGVVAWTKRDWLARRLALNGHTIDYPNMIDGPNRGCGSSGAYSFDDIFIDFTVARVELSDSPTWAEGRRKEVQLPVRWSSSELDVRVNIGAFSPDQSVYLYVIDGSGNVNQNGYPVRVGGKSILPAPPRDVFVQ